MSARVNPIPEGYQSVIPSLNVRGGDAAIRFYQDVFGAEERFRMAGPDGSVMHAELQFGDRVMMLCDETPEWGALSPASMGGCPMSLNHYCPDCDALTAKAVAHGAKLLREPTTYAWGERSSMVQDPFGFRWAICTHVEDVTPEEVQRRLAESGMVPPA